MATRMMLAAALAAGALAAACGSDGGEEEVQAPRITFPHTVTLPAERGLVAPTGEVFDHADFKNGDLVTYKNQTIKIQTGCEVSQAHCRPMHVCRPTPSSKPRKFSSLDEVCMNHPEDTEPSNIANAETGMGFTIRLNTADGFGRFWVKEVKGAGDSAQVTLVYSLFHMDMGL